MASVGGHNVENRLIWELLVEDLQLAALHPQPGCPIFIRRVRQQLPGHLLVVPDAAIQVD